VSRRSGVSLEDLRRTNMSRLLSRVHFSGPTSRAVLTRDLNLNRSTIGDLSAELVALGLVSEGETTTDGRSGRPSHIVRPNIDRCVGAINVEVDRIEVALVALGGRVLVRRQRYLGTDEHQVGQVVATCARMLRECLGERPEVTIVGVGAAVPGAVGAGGVVRFAPNLGWVDEPFEQLLADELRLPVRAANDARLGALAEHLRGVAVGYTEVSYISGGVGIGGAFFAGGMPLTGAGGYAGEVGHLLVDSAGTQCRCGGAGCWETKIGENQLLALAGRKPGGGFPAVAEVIQAAKEGDSRCLAALDEVAEWTGVGLRAVINVFNPEVVVLGGNLAQLWYVRQPIIDTAIRRAVLMSPRSDVVICSAQLGADTLLTGAAELAFAPLLSDPSRISRAASAL
jgi:predicted NBD/HSP70 family sugar kinase